LRRATHGEHGRRAVCYTAEHMTGVIGVALGLVVVAVVGWLTLLVSRRVFAVEGEQLRAAALTAQRAREGADPDTPIEVESPAQIEPRVEREPCLRCGGKVHVDAHEIGLRDQERLSRVLGKCGGCGAMSTTWVRVKLLD
jgi:hypothetical protein